MSNYYAGPNRRLREGPSFSAPSSFADYVDANRRESRGPYARTPPPLRTRRQRPRTTLEQLYAMLPNAGQFPILSDDAMRAKAKADAMAIIGPMLERANADYGARVDRGSEAVKGYTGFFADRLAGMVPQVRDAYSRQQDITGQIGDSLVGAQTREGERSVGSLSDALKLMGAPNAEGTVGTQNALTANAAGTTQRLSASELMRLVNEGTAQESYAAQQPGIAALQGGENLRDFLSQAQDLRADEVGDINEQGLSLGQALLSQYYGANEANRGRRADIEAGRANITASWLSGEAQRKLDERIFQVDTATKLQQLRVEYETKMASAANAAERNQITADYNSRRIAIMQQNADTNALNANKPPQKATWQEIVADATEAAENQVTTGEFGERTRASWEQAYAAVVDYIRLNYPHLKDQAVRAAATAALRKAGFPLPPAPPVGPPVPGKPYGPPTSTSSLPSAPDVFKPGG